MKQRDAKRFGNIESTYQPALFGDNEMKTAVIYNTIEKIWYAVEEGDWTKFQDVYINMVAETEQQGALQNELSDLLYGGEGDNEGKLQLNTVELKEFAEAIRAGALVVECGFLP